MKCYIVVKSDMPTALFHIGRDVVQEGEERGRAVAGFAISTTSRTRCKITRLRNLSGVTGNALSHILYSRTSCKQWGNVQT